LELKALTNQYGIGCKKIDAFIVDGSIYKVLFKIHGIGLPLNLKINELLKLVHKMSKTCSSQAILRIFGKGMRKKFRYHRR